VVVGGAPVVLGRGGGDHKPRPSATKKVGTPPFPKGSRSLGPSTLFVKTGTEKKKKRSNTCGKKARNAIEEKRTIHSWGLGVFARLVKGENSFTSRVNRLAERSSKRKKLRGSQIDIKFLKP